VICESTRSTRELTFSVVGATITLGNIDQVVNILGLGEIVKFGDGQSVELTVAHIAAIVAGHMTI
jgi:hypothetical protein